MTWSRERCALCSARTLNSTDRHFRFSPGEVRCYPLACDSCGLLLPEDLPAETFLKELRSDLAAPHFKLRKTASYGLDTYTLRSAATLVGKGIEPADPDQAQCLRRPHGELAAEAKLIPLTDLPAVPVSLGVMCRPADLDQVLGEVELSATWASGAFILVDAPPTSVEVISVAGFPKGSVRMAGRPLSGDFAAQRNALRAFSPTDWMLQLDADERLPAETGALLGALCAMAVRQGVRSIGLPRQNHVDGILTDLYPDTQYRLNHRSIRFVGTVHERPDRPWQTSMITLHGSIIHDLFRQHVETRSQRYEALSAGHGRLEEFAALLTPYRD